MEKTVRYSKKREAILESIRATKCHPSAEQVYQTLKPDHPDLSLGTVYRNLVFFRERGMIQSVGVVNGQERFDGMVEPHPHFVCTRCGRVLDLEHTKMDQKMNETVNREYGIQVAHHELTFYGLCQTCKQTAKSYNQKSY